MRPHPQRHPRHWRPRSVRAAATQWRNPCHPALQLPATCPLVPLPFLEAGTSPTSFSFQLPTRLACASVTCLAVTSHTEASRATQSTPCSLHPLQQAAGEPSRRPSGKSLYSSVASCSHGAQRCRMQVAASHRDTLLAASTTART
jgi:hypothetical protein